MSNYFLDTSALIKRYVPETGSNWIRAITRSGATNAIFIAQITQAEVVSGISRRMREGKMSGQVAHLIRQLMDRHVKGQYEIIRLNQSIIAHAEDLLELYALRAYDAVQLASALENNANLIRAGLSDLTVVSADQRLLTIAAAENLKTDDPNLHP